MHKARFKARAMAFKGGDGVWNPYFLGREVSRTSSRANDLEAGPPRSKRHHSEPFVQSADSDEPADTHPHHANTAPPTSATTEKAPDNILKSTSPTDDFSSPGTTTVNSGDNHSRRRLVPNIFRKHHNTEGSDGSQDSLKRTGSTRSRNTKGEKYNYGIWPQLRATVFGSYINLLLLCAPAGIGLYYAKVDGKIIFVVNFLAIIPLAGQLSYATEELAMRVGETLGGLLNASFGNAVELIVSIIALFQNKISVVQASLIGSILSNLLLVMGMCFFFGGINRPEQHFNVVVAQTAASLLALAVASLIIPTVFIQWSSDNEDAAAQTVKQDNIAELSRGTSIILLVVYGCFLFFQLHSHKDIYNEPSKKTPKRKSSKVHEGAVTKIMARQGDAMAAATGGQINQEGHAQIEEEGEAEELPQISVSWAVGTLIVSTVLIGFCAEFMVDGIGAVTQTGAISSEFIALILIPIVGNAAEHATAVTVAIKDKMDLAIGVAIGSSLQIAYLVLPLIVTIGWIAGKDDMTLNFDGFQLALVFVSMLIVNYLIADGKSHWLEGMCLMSTYVIIALAAWFYPSNENLVE